MARNEGFVEVPPEVVWSVLADPACFADWVVGARRIRGWDDGWPAAGTRFYHEVGLPPVIIRDHTESLEAVEPQRLRMRARARPFGTAFVTVELRPQDGGTHVTMTEEPADPLTKIATLPWWWAVVRGRNAESMRRLCELARKRSGG